MLAQLKYRSICSRPIRAIKVLITGYDMAKAVVCREEHQYLDLEIGRDEYWGSKEAVYLPDRSVRSYSAAVLAVYYADGGSYVSDSQRWEPLQEQAGLDTKLWDKELAKQYRIDTTPKSVFAMPRVGKVMEVICASAPHRGQGQRDTPSGVGMVSRVGLFLMAASFSLPMAVRLPEDFNQQIKNGVQPSDNYLVIKC